MDVFEIERESSKARKAAEAASAAAASAAAAAEAGIGLKDHFRPLKNLSAAQRQKELHKEIQFVEHTWPVDQLCMHFHTDVTKGLSEAQVLINRGRYSENKLSPGYSLPWWLRYLKAYTNLFSLLLIVACILCFVAYAIDKFHNKENLYLGLVLAVVVVATSSFTFFQEHKSERMMESFRHLIPATCRVVRGGRVAVVKAAELVPGDVVEMNDGDKVPADIRIVQAEDFTVDNSALTGESESVERSSDLSVSSDGRAVTEPLEASNLCFYGTIVAGGHARGVVIGTGDNTAMGQIAGLAVLTPPVPTPLAVELNQFVCVISVLAVAMGLLFFGIGLMLGDPFLQTVVFGIGVIVANVPEGLMAAVTVSLALAAQRLHVRHVLVKNLQSVETLGSCTVIASDKTGTLTQNRMTVQHCWYDLRVFDCPLARNRVEWEAGMKGAAAERAYEPQSPTFQKLQLIISLCSNAVFLTEGLVMSIEMRRPDFDLQLAPCAGDASEQGLLRFVEPLRPAKELRDLYAKLFEIKFSPVNKWQLSVHMQSAQNRLPPLLVMKGAPERVLDRCSHIMVNGQVFDLTSEARGKFQEAYEQMGGYGERVLAMAYRELDGFSNDFAFSSHPRPNFPVSGLTFVGMVSLMDPPREGVVEAVHRCRRARVKVMMVTGDHPITAKAIATKVGILDPDQLSLGTAAVVTGDDIRAWSGMTPSEERGKWDEALSHEQLIFARVSPSHKLLLVEHCQRRGEIVAVTGDGVNDAPALKKADIGIAMGLAGKDVSKEAADMILLDDNFASIVSGVEEGRLIFDNLKKTICYALTVNIPELVPYLANVLLGMPLALSTVLMLAICLGTDMLPAISLAYEEKESDIMDRPPRNARVDRLVSWRLVSHAYLIIGVVQTLAGFLAYLAVFNDYGYTPKILTTIGFSFDESPLLCLLPPDSKEPIACGYGCDTPNYNFTLPDDSSPPARLPYCFDGCPAPNPTNASSPSPSPVDPFSEMGLFGFKGRQFCSVTCASPATAFPGGVAPKQCADAGMMAQVGFPGRQTLGRPEAQPGSSYWWAGRRQLWPNPAYQVAVLQYAQSAYFVAVIVTQWANLLVCKTRRLSIFQQGMNNHVLTFALVFETAIAAALLYWPLLQEVFSTRPINILYWFIGLPFAISILVIGEIRKLCIRRFPGGWVDKWTNW